MPAHLRKSSTYAERGTALHAAMVHLIDENEDLESLVGKTINDYAITRDDVENALRPTFAYAEQLLDAPGAKFYLERRVVAAFHAACEEALSGAPRLECGAWCRFCAARPICPAHTGPLLDLAQFQLPTPAAPPSKEAYLQLLARGLNLVDAVKEISTALRDQAKRALENGVPGYTLSAGRAERSWHDEDAAIAALIGLGLARDDLRTLRSPAQVELRANARGLKFPKELIVSTRSGTSLTRVEKANATAPGRTLLREQSQENESR